jgi:hypothetical protein
MARRTFTFNCQPSGIDTNSGGIGEGQSGWATGQGLNEPEAPPAASFYEGTRYSSHFFMRIATLETMCTDLPLSV